MGVGRGVGAAFAAWATEAVSTMSAMAVTAIRPAERGRIFFMFMDI
jgi:hypothetical protein